MSTEDPRDRTRARTDADCHARDETQTAAALVGTAHVVIASTRAADGTYEDRTGPLLVDWLRGRGLEVTGPVVVPDGPAVGDALRAALGEAADVVITSGGTGITPDDRTPEETEPFVDRPLPGILEEIRRRGASQKMAALLSRGVAGMAGRSLVVNLPGSRGGVKDGIAVLDPLLDHLLAQRDGEGHQ
ncbi:MogA/MoaB family molybdenum cofactor biosynthesis protein [Brachybacterium sp. EF45031]|uniref:MogA/MoaB family molybdenum cofactor biosynthesis protein n=1 Tax=Brachybacterium sillae TaxID=2810536 RepID=UPI00217DAA1B|nr:MogA/MoaB family molybdenum cofactor biosynthesis protein [Brachybacterium sillae]MCS6711376.1 MogA/MoaB family molybdenum cofactor biosynthesis protein [Brachybacterium sillae]